MMFRWYFYAAVLAGFAFWAILVAAFLLWSVGL